MDEETKQEKNSQSFFDKVKTLLQMDLSSLTKKKASKGIKEPQKSDSAGQGEVTVADSAVELEIETKEEGVLPDTVEDHVKESLSENTITADEDVTQVFDAVIDEEQKKPELVEESVVIPETPEPVEPVFEEASDPVEDAVEDEVVEEEIEVEKEVEEVVSKSIIRPESVLSQLEQQVLMNTERRDSEGKEELFHRSDKDSHIVKPD